jgi:integrase
MVEVQVRNEAKQTLQISEINPLLLAFQKYLQMNYSNEKTRYLYEIRAIKFLNDIYAKTKVEPRELTQDMLDDYSIWLNKSKNVNPFYIGFIRAFRQCFDRDKKTFRLETKIDKSKARTGLEEFDWIDKTSVDKLIEKGSPYISLLTRIYSETGRRLNEVISCDLESKDWDLCLVKKRLRGLAKGNVEFVAHFSKETAGAIYDWMKSPLCVNKNKPFYPYKASSSEPYANPSSAVWYELRKECRLLEIKNVTGGEPHPHCFRHFLGRYLSQEKKWPIEMVAAKLLHKKLDNTRKYATPSMEQIEKKEDEEIFNK